MATAQKPQAIRRETARHRPQQHRHLRVALLAALIFSASAPHRNYTYDAAANRTGEQPRREGSSALDSSQTDPQGDRGPGRPRSQINATARAATFNNVNELTGLSSGGPVRVSGTLSKAGWVTVNGTAATMPYGKAFVANPTMTTGTNTLTITAIDSGSNSGTNTYHVALTTSGSSQSPTHDANGNLTSDGTNGYFYDAENRLLQITYPGSGNNSQFTYDALGHRVKIVERSGGSITATRQFVWLPGAAQPSEERDGSGAVVKRFYGLGQQIAGTNYFYSTDHLGSVREMTDTSQVVQARYTYDPYGRTTKVSGSMDADFQFAGYFAHGPSGLNLTLFRGYSPNLGRWLSRDPLTNAEMLQGPNLYVYVGNTSINLYDPYGQGSIRSAISAVVMSAVATLGNMGSGGQPDPSHIKVARTPITEKKEREEKEREAKEKSKKGKMRGAAKCIIGDTLLMWDPIEDLDFILDYDFDKNFNENLRDQYNPSIPEGAPIREFF